MTDSIALGYLVKQTEIAVEGGDSLQIRSLLNPGQLAAFIGRHANAHCTVLIVDPNRSNRAAFMQSMKAIGYICHESQIVAPLHDMSSYKGRLLHFQNH